MTPPVPPSPFRKKKKQACAAILMASCDGGVDLPLVPRPWWEAFVGPGRSADVSNACDAILAIGDGTDADNRRSRCAFVPSLLSGGPSFNDPGQLSLVCRVNIS